ncbi:MAG TPA: glycosyltransferase [Terracidiphilus sp.]|jgi:GT2 family glycosyltransferase
MTSDSRASVAIVAIGRNEGERLKNCLRAALDGTRTVVYVDSGSTDGSAEFARVAGCTVIELDPPFSAARARNEGFACAMKYAPDATFVQFVDGDCALVEGWLECGMAALESRPDVAVVCGHVREIHPEASVYNRLFNLEWRQTAGEIDACGGIFMVRPAVFEALSGFRADVIAAEDNEFCVRVRRAGQKILLLDAAMVLHDAAMRQFKQWWRRARRTGHAYAQVAALHGGNQERYFVRECRRVWAWGLGLPVVALAFAPFTHGLSLLLLAAYPLQFGWIFLRGRQRKWAAGDAAVYAFFTVLTKFPALEGMLAYYWRRMRGKTLTIMEHKES